MGSNRELAEGAYAAINAGDLDRLLDHVHPDIEFRSLVAEADDRAYLGHAGVRDWWESVSQAMGGLRFELGEARESEDRIVMRVRVTGRIGGVEVPQFMWWAARLQDGKAIWWAAFRSEREAVEALGLES